MMKCKSCKWWCGSVSPEEGFPRMGDCRLEAPKVLQYGDVNSGIEAVTRWPRTEARDWCAKHEIALKVVEVSNE